MYLIIVSDDEIRQSVGAIEDNGDQKLEDEDEWKIEDDAQRKLMEAEGQSSL